MVKLIWCVVNTSHVLKYDPNTSFPFPPSELVTPITSTIITGICMCNVYHISLTSSNMLQVELRYPGHRRRCPVLWVFSVIRVIVLSISAIMNFKVTASSSDGALDSLYFLRVVFNYWVSIDVACFTFDALVCHVVVENPIDSSPGGYMSVCRSGLQDPQAYPL